MIKKKLVSLTAITLLTVIIIFLLYKKLDTDTAFSDMQKGYSATENDLAQIIYIINTTDLSKSAIYTGLKSNGVFVKNGIYADTLPLGRVLLVFEGERLRLIEDQW